ncbi:hypothetical protein BD779DRAFT_1526991 [Infundibulicybe gibba]|nr:hypothetical protein BD779DRAFT_1526991 [Infundibulicybe gibba]
MSSSSIPLFPIERTVRSHGILCTVGFLILLPIGVLVARYARNWTNRWWLGHGMIQFLISGPLVLGAFIHFVKFPSAFQGRRPPQNYFHAFLGLVILVLAAEQVHYGLYTEWLLTGNIHSIPPSAKHAWLALIIVFWVLYAAGLAFLPKQFKQEAKGRNGDGGKSTPLQNSNPGSTHNA